MKILTIVGARPQFIKASVVSRELALHPAVEEMIIHTGQHYDENMSNRFFTEMKIPKPYINLGINQVNPGTMVGRITEGVEEQIISEKPDAVIVYGDTNSTLGGALAASKQNIKLIHIEAGLRCFNMKMPEELNRVITDRISNLLFCPTQVAMDNLREEGYDGFTSDYFLSGDVMYDAALFYKEHALNEISAMPELYLKEFVLCTIHRAENVENDKKLAGIISGINKIANEVKVVCPLHPRTAQRITELGLRTNFTTIDPVGYFEMIRLLDKCKLVLTDSGGLQKEAYFSNKICICLRDETEWKELADDGFVIISGSNPDAIVESFHSARKAELNFETKYYGNGKAGSYIVNEILKSF